MSQAVRKDVLSKLPDKSLVAIYPPNLLDIAAGYISRGLVERTKSASERSGMYEGWTVKTPAGEVFKISVVKAPQGVSRASNIPPKAFCECIGKFLKGDSAISTAYCSHVLAVLIAQGYRRYPDSRTPQTRK